MKNFVAPMLMLGLSAGAAFAGGVDRSGQGIGFLFESGNYSELSFGRVMPTVEATSGAYGNVAGDYTIAAAGVKFDVNDSLSFGLGIDQPYGADVFYTAPAVLDLGAHLESRALTALGRYKFGNGLSVHGGLSNTTVSGWYDGPGPGAPTDIAPSSDMGYVVGAAYERPEIAARVALTYFSGTDHVDPSSNSSFNAPQAVNLDFQTGIAANTLLFGSVRWADWSETVIRVAGNPIVRYPEDSVTYNLGVGRKFSDTWSGALTLGYEEAQGGNASALAPTDGYLSIGLGGTYTRGNMKITGGLRSIQLGDATTAAPVGTWSGNSAIAAGVKISFTF